VANVSPSKSASQSAGTGKAAPKGPKEAKGAGKPGGSRRDRLASFEAARKKEQRNRTIRLLVICGVLAMALLAYPVYLFVDDYQARNATLASLGTDVAAAGCDTPVESPASGNQDHVEAGTKVDYSETPPAFGSHYDTPAPFVKRFYTMSDRPDVETLVHNLEHGYTVAWYRDGAPDEVAKTLNSIAKTFSSDDYDPADKFIAAPWSEADGAFPDGKNLVLARWTADPVDPTDTTKQFGVRQSCTGVSGQAIADFMAKYPVGSSPEPSGA
jgi:hypothetical protein